MSERAARQISRMPKLADGSPMAYHLLKPQDLPFTIELYDEANGAKVWEVTVHRPDVLTVPSFRPRRTMVVVTYLRSGVRVITTADGATAYEDGRA